MTDTPLHIKELQLKIWLSKSPMERLKQMMDDNTSLVNFWMTAKKQQHSLLNEAAGNNPSSH